MGDRRGGCLNARRSLRRDSGGLCAPEAACSCPRVRRHHVPTLQVTVDRTVKAGRRRLYRLSPPVAGVNGDIDFLARSLYPAGFQESMTHSYYEHGSLGRVEIGAMRESEERAFVVDSWLHSYVDAQGHGPKSGSPHRHAYLSAFGRALDGLLSDPEVIILVARDAECAPRAFGWGAAVDGSLLWVSTKRDHRKEGVARLLFTELERECGPFTYFGFRSRHDDLAEKLGLQFRAYDAPRKSA